MCQFGFIESTSTCDALLDFTGYYKLILINIARRSLLILKKHLIHLIITCYLKNYIYMVLEV